MDNRELKLHLEEFRSGNSTAFFEFYEELKTPVYTIIYRILYDKMMSEDVMQEIFLRLYKTPPPTHIKNLRAWIFRMARNLAIDCKRKIRESETLPHDKESSAYALENTVAQDWILNRP